VIVAGKTIVSLSLYAVLVAVSFTAEAQQANKIPRIGYIAGTGTSSNPGPRYETFRVALQELGYVEGKNVVIEPRFAEGNLDRVRDLVAELVQLKVDVLFVSVLPAIRAAKQATKTIPIVMVTSIDPVATGLVDSLARPGGNITGVAYLGRELSGKRLELLKEVVPKLNRVRVLWDSNAPAAAIGFKEYESAMRALKVELQSLEVRGPTPDLDGAFREAANRRTSSLITISAVLLLRDPRRIAELAIKNRLPSMYERRDYVEAGGLMSYSADDGDQHRRAAIYVDKIIKGAKPADLPVERPTKFELVINLKTAKQIGIRIPPDVLARADRVIK
jgi:putative ABC transport system substrate-binding protein